MFGSLDRISPCVLSFNLDAVFCDLNRNLYISILREFYERVISNCLSYVITYFMILLGLLAKIVPQQNVAFSDFFSVNCDNIYSVIKYKNSDNCFSKNLTWQYMVNTFLLFHVVWPLVSPDLTGQTIWDAKITAITFLWP